MINHISIGVHDTERVAKVLAELWGGYALPFPPAPEGWMVLADDGKGTGVEVTTIDTVLEPGAGLPPEEEDFDINTPTEDYEAKFVATGKKPQYVVTHLNINTKLSIEEVKAVAKREGWRCFVANRGEGAFQLIELWIENHFMLELMTPEMTEIYVNLVTPESYAEWLQIPLPPRAPAAENLRLIG
ncbi:MAG: hypothetical protein R2747_18530 [Pyrinomonadaceae bacterium]